MGSIVRAAPGRIPKTAAPSNFVKNGAKAMAWETTTKRVGREFFSVHSVEALRSQSDHWLESQGTPDRTDGNCVRDPITTSRSNGDAAFSLLGEHLNDLPTPDEAIFYTSGRTSKRGGLSSTNCSCARFGTNNLPDCSNMCHESSGAGLGTTIGVGKGTVPPGGLRRSGGDLPAGTKSRHEPSTHALGPAARR